MELIARSKSIGKDLLEVSGDDKIAYNQFKGEFKKSWEQMNVPGDALVADEYSKKMWDKRSEFKDPAVPEDPWAKSYGSRAKELKSAWTKRTTATKKNPSFDNFQAWLRSRHLVGGGVDAIIQKLMNETYTAIASIGAGPQYDQNAAIPMPGETQPSPFGQASRSPSGPITEKPFAYGPRSGPPPAPDYTVPLDRATREPIQ
jgi:hypothetical protein